VTALGHFDAIRERRPSGAFSVSFFTRREFFWDSGNRRHSSHSRFCFKKFQKFPIPPRRRWAV